MPQGDSVISAFTSGELSPRLYGRTDLKKYQHGMKEINNFIVQKHGGLIRRSGTRFVSDVKDSSRFTRLLPFQFSTQQTYVLEFGHLYVRFHRDRGRLQHGATYPVTATAHAAGVSTLTIGAHSIKPGEQISVQDVLTNDPAFTIGYNGTFTVSEIAATTVSYVNPNTPAGAFVAGAGTVTLTSGTVPTEIATPYTEDDLALLKITQSADVLYIAHGDYEPRLLSRSAGADTDPAIWSLTALNPWDGPYLPVNTVAAATVNVTATGVAGDSRTLVCSNAAVAQINGGQGFLATDVGRLIRWHVTGNPWWHAIITGFTDRQTVTVTLRTTVGATTATPDWRMGIWSDTTGWPFCVTFWQDRLWFGGNRTNPQTLWGSKVGDYDDFRPDDASNTPIVSAEHAISITINAAKVNTIHWLISDDHGLIIPTNGGVFVGVGGDASQLIPVDIKPHVYETAAQRPQPQPVSGAVLLPMSADRKLREFVFRFDADKFVAPDLTILSEHITSEGMHETALQLEPDVVLWAVRHDGLLVSMTYEREENVVAWSRHQLGGSLAGADFPAAESLAVVRDGDDDLVYLVVKRTVNNVTVRYVEFIEAIFPDTATVEDWPFSDCCLSLDDARAITAVPQLNPLKLRVPGHGLNPGDRIRVRGMKGLTELNDRSFLVVTVLGDDIVLGNLEGGETINGSQFGAYLFGGVVNKEVQQVAGLVHLANQTIAVLADGGTHANKVVSAGGLVQLDRWASIVHIGLPYVSRGVTLPLVIITGEESRGKMTRPHKLIARFNRSLGGRIGSVDPGGKLHPVIHRLGNDPAGQQAPLFSGSKPVLVADSSTLDATVMVETDEPLPMNILSLIVEGTADRI